MTIDTLGKPERKGLRFEVEYVQTVDDYDGSDIQFWRWTLIGADGPVCASPVSFNTEAECRSHIAKNKGRMKAASYAKVLTID